MDTAQGYAICAGGFFFLFFAANLISLLVPAVKYVCRWASKHLTYPYLVRRHKYLGPWSRAQVLVQLVYTAANILCISFLDLSFQVSTIREAGLQAGAMSVINTIPLFAGPHLSFLADCLGVSLMTVRQVHRSAAVMASALALFHVVVAVASKPSFTLDLPQNTFAVVVRVLSLLLLPRADVN
jgi:hypothetical protein